MTDHKLLQAQELEQYYSLLAEGVATSDAWKHVEEGLTDIQLYQLMRHASKKAGLKMDLRLTREEQKSLVEFHLHSKPFRVYERLATLYTTRASEGLFESEKLRSTTGKNKFDRVALADVVEYFEARLVGEGYVTEEDLRKYIESAFIQVVALGADKILSNDSGRKNRFRAIFYGYWLEKAGKTSGQAEKYARLCSDYFVGHSTDQVKANWSKDYKSPTKSR